MDDCTGYIGLCHAGVYDGLYDAGIYAGYADNRNSKELVHCEKKEGHVRNLAGFLAMPVAAFLIRYLSSSLTEYQIARLQAVFSGGGEEDYFTEMLHSFWQQNKWIGEKWIRCNGKSAGL